MSRAYSATSIASKWNCATGPKELPTPRSRSSHLSGKIRATESSSLAIVQVEAAQLPRLLDDLDACAINTNYAVQANLIPTRDAIALEDAHSSYANLLAVRTVDKDKPWVAKLVKAFQSPEVKHFVETNFSGSVVAAF